MKRRRRLSAAPECREQVAVQRSNVETGIRRGADQSEQRVVGDNRSFRLKNLRGVVIAAETAAADGGNEEPQRRLERDEIRLKRSQSEFLVGPDRCRSCDERV